jgi:hypothetical protein
MWHPSIPRRAWWILAVALIRALLPFRRIPTVQAAVCRLWYAADCPDL